MELAVLNSQYQPARLVEGYSSLIWTERFFQNGDFQLESQDVGGTLAQLPLEDPAQGVPPTIVTLRDSNVPMVVESHSIEKTLKDPPKITTTGRSLETVLDRRSNSMRDMSVSQAVADIHTDQLTAVDAAYYVIGQVIGDSSRGAAGVDPIPEVKIKLTRPSGYTPPANTTSFSVSGGELYSWALDHITSEKYGFRAIRPLLFTDTQFTVEIYTGADRTTQVVFDARFDQFTSSKYLLSTLGWKNTMQVQAQNGSVVVTDGGSYSGLGRRVGYLDATSETDQMASGTMLDALMPNLGTVELAKHLETVLFSGEVSRLNGYSYGKDFFLGDIVKLSGDYGLSQFVRVSEYVRSVDNQGEKAYPTFEALS